MKIKIKMKYRYSLLFIIGGALISALLIFMATVFFQDGGIGPTVLCIVLELFIVAALAFRFNYCLYIDEKRLIAIEQQSVKVLKYEAISVINVRFKDEMISLSVRMKSGEEHFIAWDRLFLGASLLFPSEAKIIMSRAFVDECCDKLSLCDKVKISNLYQKKK